LSLPLPHLPASPKSAKSFSFPRSRAPPTRSDRPGGVTEAVLTPSADARGTHRQRRRCAPSAAGNPLVRARICASACCRTGKRCPTTVSRHTTTWFPSDWQRSMLSCGASATCCWYPPARRSTASHRRPIWPPTPSSSSRARSSTPGQFRAQLTLAGYAHVTQVVAPGEYSIRGGLVDLFPMGSQLPYRLDLFDNEIESIKTFDVDTSARSIRSRRFACCQRASFRSTKRAARASVSASAKCSKVTPALGNLQGRLERHCGRRHRVLAAAVFSRKRPPFSTTCPARPCFACTRTCPKRFVPSGARRSHATHALGRSQPPAAATGRALPGRGTFLRRRQGLCPREPDAGTDGPAQPAAAGRRPPRRKPAARLQAFHRWTSRAACCCSPKPPDAAKR
jgi:hypothetical protein